MFRYFIGCSALCLVSFAGIAAFRAVEGEKLFDPAIVGVIYVFPLVAAIVTAGVLKVHEKPPVVVGLSVIAFSAAYPLEAVGLMVALAGLAASIAGP